MRSLNVFVSIFLVLDYFSRVCGTGVLYDPPNRGVMWKYGFSTARNYDYMNLNCGGKKQHEQLPASCGICGDPENGSRRHEDGGRFGKRIISRWYPAGLKEMQVKVELLSFEKGFFEFRICAANSNHVNQSCLNQNLLPIKEGYLQGTPMRFFPKRAGDFHVTVAIPPDLVCDRYNLLPIKEGYLQGTAMRLFPKRAGDFHVTVAIPPDLVCDTCVMQWRYHTGNSWGTDPDNGRQGHGQGLQEEFFNCADIRIGGKVPNSVKGNLYFSPDNLHSTAGNVSKPTDRKREMASVEPPGRSRTRERIPEIPVHTRIGLPEAPVDTRIGLHSVVKEQSMTHKIDSNIIGPTHTFHIRKPFTLTSRMDGTIPIAVNERRPAGIDIASKVTPLSSGSRIIGKGTSRPSQEIIQPSALIVQDKEIGGLPKYTSITSGLNPLFGATLIDDVFKVGSAVDAATLIVDNGSTPGDGVGKTIPATSVVGAGSASFDLISAFNKLRNSGVKIGSQIGLPTAIISNPKIVKPTASFPNRSAISDMIASVSGTHIQGKLTTRGSKSTPMIGGSQKHGTGSFGLISTFNTVPTAHIAISKNVQHTVSGVEQKHGLGRLSDTTKGIGLSGVKPKKVDKNISVLSDITKPDFMIPDISIHDALPGFTGVSDADMSGTISVLSDFTKPGHLIPEISGVALKHGAGSSDLISVFNKLPAENVVIPGIIKHTLSTVEQKHGVGNLSGTTRGIALPGVKPKKLDKSGTAKGNISGDISILSDITKPDFLIPDILIPDVFPGFSGVSTVGKLETIASGISVPDVIPGIIKHTLATVEQKHGVGNLSGTTRGIALPGVKPKKLDKSGTAKGDISGDISILSDITKPDFLIPDILIPDVFPGFSGVSTVGKLETIASGISVPDVTLPDFDLPQISDILGLSGAAGGTTKTSPSDEVPPIKPSVLEPPAILDKRKPIIPSKGLGLPGVMAPKLQLVKTSSPMVASRIITPTEPIPEFSIHRGVDTVVGERTPFTGSVSIGGAAVKSNILPKTDVPLPSVFAADSGSMATTFMHNIPDIRNTISKVASTSVIGGTIPGIGLATLDQTSFTSDLVHDSSAAVSPVLPISIPGFVDRTGLPFADSNIGVDMITLDQSGPGPKFNVQSTVDGSRHRTAIQIENEITGFDLGSIPSDSILGSADDQGTDVTFTSMGDVRGQPVSGAGLDVPPGLLPPGGRFTVLTDPRTGFRESIPANSIGAQTIGRAVTTERDINSGGVFPTGMAPGIITGPPSGITTPDLRRQLEIRERHAIVNARHMQAGTLGLIGRDSTLDGGGLIGAVSSNTGTVSLPTIGMLMGANVGETSPSAGRAITIRRENRPDGLVFLNNERADASMRTAATGSIAGSIGQPGSPATPVFMRGGIGPIIPGSMAGGFGSVTPGSMTGGFGPMIPGSMAGRIGPMTPGTMTGRIGPMFPGSMMGGVSPMAPGFGGTRSVAGFGGMRTGVNMTGGLMTPGSMMGGMGPMPPRYMTGGIGPMTPGSMMGRFGTLIPGSVPGGIGTMPPGFVGSRPVAGMRVMRTGVNSTAGITGGGRTFGGMSAPGIRGFLPPGMVTGMVPGRVPMLDPFGRPMYGRVPMLDPFRRPMYPVPFPVRAPYPGSPFLPGGPGFGGFRGFLPIPGRPLIMPGTPMFPRRF